MYNLLVANVSKMLLWDYKIYPKQSLWKWYFYYSIRKARESFLIDLGGTLEPLV